MIRYEIQEYNDALRDKKGQPEIRMLAVISDICHHLDLGLSTR